MRLLRRSSRRNLRNGATSWKTWVRSFTANALRRGAVEERQRMPLYVNEARGAGAKLLNRHLRAAGTMLHQSQDARKVVGGNVYQLLCGGVP